jgi:asparagine synthase (glutamine-hydrolysing)
MEFKSMGSIAAAFNKLGQGAVELVFFMLQELDNRGVDRVQITTPTSAVIVKSLQELKNKRILSNIAVGNSLLNYFSEENPSVVMKKGYALAFEGRLFSSSVTSDANEVARVLKSEPEVNAEHVINKFDGTYTFAIVLSNKIIGGRDFFGTHPLYIGKNNTICALASARKALWAIGIRQIRPVPLGNLVTINNEGFTFKTVTNLLQPTQKRIGIDRAARRFHHLLLKSMIKRSSDSEKIAIAFSGGIDSSIIAFLAKSCTKKVFLITVGLEGQSELHHSQNAAKALDLPLLTKTYTIDDEENVLKKALWLIEEPNPMKVGVAIPIFWAAQIATENGCKVMLAGQGADELLGGYHRYLNQYLMGGQEAVQKVMFHDLATSYEANFQRDFAVCAFHKVELRLPFIDRKVISYALSLALDLKITSPEDELRKHVLRRMAQNLKLPTFISGKTKKAVQYATGVDKALKKLAKRKGLTQKDYIEQVFEEVCPAYVKE